MTLQGRPLLRELIFLGPCYVMAWGLCGWKGTLITAVVNLVASEVEIIWPRGEDTVQRVKKEAA